ncbi:MAG TPA: hypothetical protein VL992_15560 [Tepidisphaeraceae bacterium]|nr:hypothetical protein [Tepidisphaeraceae bacterium]
MLVAIGGALRLRQYLSLPSFWENEVAVMLNARHYTASELPFSHLVSYNTQNPVAAPPIFLLITKWMGDFFNYSEWSVRLLPLLCSLAAIGLFAHLAWRLLQPAAAVWAVALLAFSDPLIFQAGDAKPYSGDVLVAVLIVWVALAFRPNAAVWKRLALASAVTAASVWISYTAVFVLAAVGLSVFEKLNKNRWRALIKLVACVLPAIASLAVVYFLSIRRQRDPNLDLFWLHLFPDWRKPLSVAPFISSGTWELFRYAFYPIGPIMLIAFGLGIVALWREGNQRLLILLLSPLAIDLAAACTYQYPFGGTRLLLYLIPFVCLLCGIGAASAGRQFRWVGRALQMILASVPVAAAAVAVYGLFWPQNFGNMRDAVHFLSINRKANETVYLMGAQTVSASRWYLPQPDSRVHLQLDKSWPIHGDNFWLVICYETRKDQKHDPAMHQPDSVLDESRSFHTRGADVLWFAPKG